MKKDIVIKAHITCPGCGAEHVEVMPDDGYIRFWDCPTCKARWMPNKNDGCVFCSYADVPCPIDQKEAKFDSH